ncbi:Putative multidrug export ATP-binding/permease protein [Phycisphaerales bacterium]|nr:Putative multidrug export ATP-binding/permease protein [Phycisphaerales bacterium]
MSVLAPVRDSFRSLARGGARFRPYLRGYAALTVVGVVGMLAEIALRLAEPWPLKIVFDRVLGARSSPALDRLLPPDLGPATMMGVVVACVVTLAVLRAGAAYANSVAFALVGNRVLTRVRSDLFAHMQRLSLRFHARARTGDLLTRVVGDVGRLQEVAVTAVVPLFVHSLTLLGMLVLMLVMNWQLGLLAAALLPLLVLITTRMGRRIRDAARRQRKREGDTGAIAAEGLAAIRTVQALGIEDRISRIFARNNQGSLAEGVKTARLSARLERGVDCVIGLVTAAVLWRGVALAREGHISPGDLIVFLAYLRSAFRPLRDMAKYAGRVSKASASAERVAEVFDIAPEITDPPHAAPAPPDVHEVRFEDVSFEYTPGVPVLTGFSLTARMGEKIALVGPSGAGKSTIAGLMLRLYDPTQGRVLLNGRDLRGYSVGTLRRRIALVPQENTLFHMSIRENILCGNPAATDAETAAACELAGAREFIRDLPDGLDSVIGERGDTLSGGQRRRIALARAAVRDAPVLILDEPTSGLDNRSRSLVSRALSRLGEGRLTLLISHDLGVAVDADQVLYIERGRVVEHGTHESLIALGGRYAAMFALQAAQSHLAVSEGAADALPG